MQKVECFDLVKAKSQWMNSALPVLTGPLLFFWGAVNTSILFLKQQSLTFFWSICPTTLFMYLLIFFVGLPPAYIMYACWRVVARSSSSALQGKSNPRDVLALWIIESAATSSQGADTHTKCRNVSLLLGRRILRHAWSLPSLAAAPR